MSALTSKQVQGIKRLTKTTNMTYKEIAAKLSVLPASVSTYSCRPPDWERPMRPGPKKFIKHPLADIAGSDWGYVS